MSYLLFGYGYTATTSGWSKWIQFNNTAYVENDMLGNLAYASHVLLAIAMILGGSLQVLPSVRNRFRKFHRINGRIVVGLACFISLAGMYLIIFRGTVGNLFMHLLTSFSGLVILVSGYMSIKTARNKNFTAHKVWAIRLYLAANGVLFFRLMIFAWFAVFGTLGVNTEDFTGITVMCVSLASYVLPLLMAEWVRDSNKHLKPIIAFPCACMLLVVSAIFLLGLFAIAAGSWYPSVVR
ncbi:DUF2306 domain-containing protein [Paraglaciecola sp.]|uniref:DUF2306 domain-containing protein n=1 Tax=Paraglaciecola sp. TaxID=1920173 RepID=UPI003EF231DA